MAVINKAETKVRLDQWDIVRLQLVIHCHLRHIHLSEHDLSCLTLLGITGEQTLEDFCVLTKDKAIFSSNQSARNALAKAEKKGLIIKQGRNKKKIFLNPSLKIQASGNIRLDYCIVHLELKSVPQLESQES